MTTTTYTAWATDAEQSAMMGREASGILVQEFIDDDGTQVYTGEDLCVYGETPDSEAMDTILKAAGWRRVSYWDTGSGQHIAQVERM